MASEMMEALMALCQEKHIDELYLLDRLEQSLAKSYADILHLPFGARVTIDHATGKVYVYELIPKEESYDEETGEYLDFDEKDVTPPDTSRIAAQHAKTEIRAIVRNAARVQIYEEFSQRIGDIITGTVLQTTPDFTIIKIREGVEAELPHFDQRRFPDERNERPVGERYSHNQRLKAIIIDVRDPNNDQPTVRGERQRPPIVVSRTHPDLIRRLFELEVPEVYDGVVEVRSIAREPGIRSKVAVSSKDDHLDPVGACVGPKGSRVRTVVSELRGERVDVVPWSDDPARCVANALSPATPAWPRTSPACTSTSRTSRWPPACCVTFPARPTPPRARSRRTASSTAASTWARTASSAATWPVRARATAASTRSSWMPRSQMIPTL